MSQITRILVMNIRSGNKSHKHCSQLLLGKRQSAASARNTVSHEVCVLPTCPSTTAGVHRLSYSGARSPRYMDMGAPA